MKNQLTDALIDGLDFLSSKQQRSGIVSFLMRREDFMSVPVDFFVEDFADIPI